MYQIEEKFEECYLRLYLTDDTSVYKESVTTFLPVTEPAHTAFTFPVVVTDKQLQMVLRYDAIAGVIVDQFRPPDELKELSIVYQESLSVIFKEPERF